MAGDLQLRVRLSADGQQLIGELKAAENSVQKFGSKVASGVVTAAKWATGIAAAGAAVTTYLVAANADAIRQIDQFADSLDMSTQTLTEWQHAAESVGVSGENMQSIFQDLQDKIGDFATTGGGEATDVFESLNIAAEDLMRLSPDKQLIAIADAMQDVNQNQKVFFMESLASDSTRLLPLLENNAQGLKKLQLEAQVLGRSISDIDAAKVTESALAMDKTKGLMTGLANEITVSLAPMLTGVSNMLFESAVEAGGFGDAVNTAVEGAITGLGFVLDVGQQLLIWSKYAQVGLTTVGQAGTGAMAAFSDTTASVINTVLRPFQDYYTWLIDKFSSLVGLAAKIGGPFAAEFKEASDWLAGLSKDTDTFLVDGSDIIALNESMKSSIATTSQELEDLLNADAPSDTLKNWIEEARKSSDDAAESSVRLRNESKSTGVVVSNNAEAAAAAQKTYAAALSESTSNSVQSLADLEEQSQRVWSAFDAGKINAEQAADAIDGIAAAGEASAKSLADFASDALDSIDPLREIERTMEQVWAAFDAGHLDAGQVSQYVDAVANGFKESAAVGENEFDSMANRVAQTLQNSIASGNWQGVGTAIGGVLSGEISGLVSQSLASSLSSSLGSVSGTLLGGLGGALAGGIVGSFFGGRKRTVTESLQLELSGLVASGFKEIEIKSTGMLGSSTRRYQQAISDTTTGIIERSFAASVADIEQSASYLGVNTVDALEGFAFNLKDSGLTLSEFTSSAAKSYVESVFAAIVDYQYAHESVMDAWQRMSVDARDVGESFERINTGKTIGKVYEAELSKTADAIISHQTTALESALSQRSMLESLQDTARLTMGKGGDNSREAAYNAEYVQLYDLLAEITSGRVIHAGTSGKRWVYAGGDRAGFDDAYAILDQKINDSQSRINQAYETASASFIDGLTTAIMMIEGVDAESAGAVFAEISDRWIAATQGQDVLMLAYQQQAERSVNELFKQMGFAAEYSAGDVLAAYDAMFDDYRAAALIAAQDIDADLAAAAGTANGEIARMQQALLAADSAAQSYTDTTLEFAEAAEKASLAAAEAERSRLTAISDFNSNMQTQLDQLALNGKNLELFNLDLEFEKLRRSAESVGADLLLVETLYGKKRADIVAEYAGQAAAAERKMLQDAITPYLQNLADWSSEELSRIEADYQERIALAEQQLRIGRELRQYVEQLRISELSPYDPGEKLQLASESFAKLLVAAENGDMEAAAKLQGAANAYLQNADSYYGRSDPYVSIFEDVTQSLDRLGIDILGGLDEDSIEKLNRQMLAEQQRIRDYTRDQLGWMVSQYDTLTSIESLLGILPDSLAKQLGAITNASAAGGAAPARETTKDLIRSQWEQMGGGTMSETDLERYASQIDSGEADINEITQELNYYKNNNSKIMDQVLALWESTGGGSYNYDDLANYAARIAAGESALSASDINYYRNAQQPASTPAPSPAPPPLPPPSPSVTDDDIRWAINNILGEKGHGDDAYMEIYNLAKNKGVSLSRLENFIPGAQSWVTSKGLAAFAKGGVFTNSIVSKPTYFDMGLMGEAGAEAIVPLHMGQQGLGIKNYSPSSQNPQVIVQTDPALIAELQQLRAEVAALLSEQSSSNSKAEQQRMAQTDATETLVRTNRTPVKMP